MGSRADTRRRGIGERLTLREGSPVIVRPLERDDGPLVQAVLDVMGKEMRLFERMGSVRVTASYGDAIELAVELPFETGAPMEAIRAAAAGEVHE